MSLIDESGAIVDPSELAAALGTTVEEIQAEDDVVLQMSLESLLDSIADTVTVENQEEEPSFVILEPAMESILDITRDIQASGAISRSDAQTLLGMTTSLEGLQESFTSLPLNSFTEVPSKVNFDVSMENILTSIGRKIIEVIKAIVRWIKDKAKAFVGLFRNNRVKAKQTEEAAKKVDDALKSSMKVQKDIDWKEITRNYAEAGQNIQDTLDSMKANRSEWDKLRQKLGEKHMDSWAKGAAERAGMGKVQVDLPSLAVYLAGDDNQGRFTSSYVSLQAITTNVMKEYITPDNSLDKLSSDIIKLDNSLFEKSELNFRGGSVSDCTAALGRIASRLNAESQDVDVFATEEPEHMVTKMITLLNASYKTSGSSFIIVALDSAVQSSNAKITALDKTIEKMVRNGETVDSRHPLVVEASNYRSAVRTCEHLDSIYRSIMNAYTKTIKIGADLAKNPAAVKAA